MKLISEHFPPAFVLHYTFRPAACPRQELHFNCRISGVALSKNTRTAKDELWRARVRHNHINILSAIRYSVKIKLTTRRYFDHKETQRNSLRLKKVTLTSGQTHTSLIAASFIKQNKTPLSSCTVTPSCGYSLVPFLRS